LEYKMFNNLKNIFFAIIGIALISVLAVMGMAILAFFLVIFAISVAVLRFKIKKAMRQQRRSQSDDDIIEAEYEIIEEEKEK